MSLELILWISFNIFILLMLALDIGVIQRKTHIIKVKEALLWSSVWIILALLFNVFIYYEFGKEKALEYFTGYILERSLSIDNIFVFVLMFSYFKVPEEYHHRVLFWGVIGALISRAALIGVGSVVVAKFGWILYIFGGFLVYSGFKMAFQSQVNIEPENNVAVRTFKKVFPVTTGYHEGKFFIIEKSKRFATPLLIALLAIEFTDIVFAFDSIPAIFAVTKDSFIIYTSNIFAILGLRTTYFALSGLMNKFHYLQIGLAMILIFIGMKMLITNFYKITLGYSLGIIAIILLASIIISILNPKKEEI